MSYYFSLRKLIIFKTKNMQGIISKKLWELYLLSAPCSATEWSDVGGVWATEWFVTCGVWAMEWFVAGGVCSFKIVVYVGV